jgi:hypothetical protein
VEGNRRKLATCGKLGAGFDIPNDERQFNVSNFHIPSFRKNISSSIRRCDGGFSVSPVMKNTVSMATTQFVSSSWTRISPRHCLQRGEDAVLC